MKKTPRLRFPEFSGEWEEKKLKDVSIKIGDGIHATPQYVDISNIKFINGNNIKNHKLVINSNTKSISKEELKKYPMSLDMSSILMSINGTIGSIGYYNNESILLGKSVAFININTKIYDKLFIGTLLEIEKMQQYFINELTGTTIKNLSLKSIRESEIYLPNIIEQQKVSKFLYLIDKKIEKQQEKVEALEEYKKGIIQKIFSQEIRFKDENGEEYPKWKKVDFKNLFEEVKEKTSDTEKHKLYSLTIENGVVPKSERYEREFLVTKDEENYKIVHKNEYVYNPMNLRFGALARHIGEKPVSVSGYYNIFKTIDNCSYGFLDNFLKTNRMMYIYNTIATGSLVEKRRVHFSQFIELSLPMPSIKEQQKIADLLLTIDKKLNKEKEKLEELKEWKKGLLQQMFV